MAIALSGTTSTPPEPATRRPVTPKHATCELPAPTKQVGSGSASSQVIASSCPSTSIVTWLTGHFTKPKSC